MNENLWFSQNTIPSVFNDAQAGKNSGGTWIKKLEPNTFSIDLLSKWVIQTQNGKHDIEMDCVLPMLAKFL